MRQIKFRGKRPNSGKWITGSLIQLFGFSYIVNDEHKNADCSTEVLSDTVSQFTGLVDRNGKEIYEGDILEERFVACDRQDTGLIDGEYCSGHYIETKRFVANMNLDYENDLITVGFFDGGCDKLLEEDELYNYPSGIYLIGNIHDNPELLDC